MNRADVADRVKQSLAETFGLSLNMLKDEADLYRDLDLDSLDAIDLVVTLKTETGIQLSETEMRAIHTVGDIINSVTRHLADAAS